MSSSLRPELAHQVQKGLVVTASVALRRARARQTDDVAKDILEYFLRHPDSADSLTGIARCRLLEQAVHRGVEATEDALAWLIAKGYLEAVPIEGAEPVFQLNRSRRDEAERFLKSLRSKAGSQQDSG